ncbi:hypothetical protein ACQ4M4_00725 [Leptolyngbya sp. AN02str]|uniref:hypothetical protein n=1 Tax=Leptolyngbya sp. AN02str TaxID=3423363 RepID=UPI003D316B42
MTNSGLTVPHGITFEGAIALTQSLMAQMDASAISETDLRQTVAQLVATENGARGFFVAYLTDERSLADQPSAGLIEALRSSPTIVSDLLVKNLAMSAAMAIAHRRNQNESMAQGSDRVRSRTTELIQQLNLSAIADKLTQLQTTLATGSGDYEPFLTRWNYDDEQRQVIHTAVKDALTR